MSKCCEIRDQFSCYLDGAITGVAMQSVAAHLDACAPCRADFAAWRAMQQALGGLGPAKPPADLALRLRVAISQERTHTARQRLARWQVRWQNTVAPLLLQASAGLASAILLIGTVAVLVGTFAAPEPLQASDAPMAMASNPRFLYSTFQTSGGEMARRGEPLIIEAYVDGAGRVYDFRILSGPDDPGTRAEIENMLLFSVFQPARVFGQPVSGLAVLSFSGVSVRG